MAHWLVDCQQRFNLLNFEFKHLMDVYGDNSHKYHLKLALRKECGLDFTQGYARRFLIS